MRKIVPIIERLLCVTLTVGKEVKISLVMDKVWNYNAKKYECIKEGSSGALKASGMNGRRRLFKNSK